MYPRLASFAPTTHEEKNPELSTCIDYDGRTFWPIEIHGEYINVQHYDFVMRCLEPVPMTGIPMKSITLKISDGQLQVITPENISYIKNVLFHIFVGRQLVKGKIIVIPRPKTRYNSFYVTVENVTGGDTFAADTALLRAVPLVLDHW